MMKKNKNSEIFNDYFGYKNPSFSAEDLIKAFQTKNNEFLYQTIDSINELRNSVIKKEIPKNENPNKIIDIVEKILEFNNQQKGTGCKIITFKQMLQRSPIAPVQVKAGNNSKHLLNETKRIVYSFHQSKEITKKVYSSIIKSI